MTYDELLKAFGAKLGEDIELNPDESGAVMLDIDGMTLTILGLEESGLVVLSGEIGEPPPEDRMERLYKAMLEANHNFAGTFGATLSINPNGGKAMLCKALPLAITDGDGFFTEVEHFVNTLETWRKLVADFRSAQPEATPQEEPVNFGGFGGFMQV